MDQGAFSDPSLEVIRRFDVDQDVTPSTMEVEEVNKDDEKGTAHAFQLLVAEAMKQGTGNDLNSKEE